MIPLVSIHPSATEELSEALAYYGNIEAALAKRFLDSFEVAVAQIRKYPEAASLVNRTVRRKLLRRFSYSIFYSVYPDTIRILAIAHQSRRPFYWLGRS